MLPSQIEQFHRDGFVLGERVLSDDQVEILRAETMRVIAEGASAVRPPIHIVNLSGQIEAPVWQIVDIWRASEPFLELVHQSEIGENIAALLGAREVRLWHDQIQYKPAQTGGANPWHQDSPLWPPLAPKTEQITAWVALDDVDEENGCMKMVPGSHRWGNQIDFLNRLRGFEAMPREWDGHKIEVVPCPVRRGHVHFHHALTWHGSGENRSGRARRAIALHYMSEKTVRAEGRHVMSPYFSAEIGQKIEGEAFPLVWSV